MDEAIASLQHGQEVTQRLTGKKVVLSLHKGNVITHAGCKSSALYQIEEGKGVAAEAKDDVGNHIVAGQPVIPNVNSTSGETLRDDFYRMANLAEGITYFAYRGNHLAYFSESSSAASTLLSFFNFFLKTLTKVVPDSSIIHEEKIFLVNPRTLLAHKGISKVAYKLAEMKEKESLGQSIQEVVNQKMHADPIMRCKHKAVIQECNMDLVLAPGRRDRGIKSETIKLLLCSMTDYELEHTIVHFNDHTTMKGKELFSQSKIRVDCQKGIPQQADAQRELSQWLARSIDSELGNSD